MVLFNVKTEVLLFHLERILLLIKHCQPYETAGWMSSHSNAILTILMCIVQLYQHAHVI
jgi:hypothetical protein